MSINLFIDGLPITPKSAKVFSGEYGAYIRYLWENSGKPKYDSQYDLSFSINASIFRDGKNTQLFNSQKNLAALSLFFVDTLEKRAFSSSSQITILKSSSMFTQDIRKQGVSVEIRPVY